MTHQRLDNARAIVCVPYVHGEIIVAAASLPVCTELLISRILMCDDKTDYASYNVIIIMQSVIG